MEGTDCIKLALDAIGYQEDIWEDYIFEMTEEKVYKLVAMGKAIKSYRDTLIRDVAKTAFTCLCMVENDNPQLNEVIDPTQADLNSFDTKKLIVLINCPKIIFSELSRVFMDEPEAIVINCLWKPDEMVWEYSIRTSDDYPNVPNLVKHLGGGGHANAGGFKHVNNFYIDFLPGGRVQQKKSSFMRSHPMDMF